MLVLVCFPFLKLPLFQLFIWFHVAVGLPTDEDNIQLEPKVLEPTIHPDRTPRSTPESQSFIDSYLC